MTPELRYEDGPRTWLYLDAESARLMLELRGKWQARAAKCPIHGAKCVGRYDPVYGCRDNP